MFPFHATTATKAQCSHFMQPLQQKHSVPISCNHCNTSKKSFHATVATQAKNHFMQTVATQAHTL
jgi:hypothetical protein